MSLAPGTRLGPYEILAPLGAGGMGEVYRARDAKLNRDVAIKVLPDLFAADRDRVMRFDREAQMLAALNHPNVAQVFGVLGPAEASPYALVMEFVEGEDIAKRLRRGAFRLDAAIPIARQIVSALEAAHGKGIIHRDLKPGNIMVTADGAVKVLDFGLARAIETDSGSSVSDSPTLTYAGTQASVILGTAAYMAPEQARGRVADKRCDVWAFGCLFYEMLSGRRAFVGNEVADVVASILRAEPDWNALPANVPPYIRSVIQRCLAKDRNARIPDVAVVRFMLDEPPALTAPMSSGAVTAGSSRRAILAFAVTGLAGVALAIAVTWAVLRRSSDSAAPPVRFAIDVPFLAGNRTVAISADGQRIVYAAGSPGNRELFVRRIDRLEAAALRGTANGHGPFLSPDGKWVGYFHGTTELRRIPIDGGPPVKICQISGVPRGASWAEDDTIIFSAADSNTLAGLMRVPAAGGTPKSLTEPDGASEFWHVGPTMLPGGRGVLFTIHDPAFRVENSQVALLDLKTGTRKTLLRGGSRPLYVSSGHLLYVTAGSLHAAPFDLERLEVLGEPVPVLDGVDAAFNVSTNGTLVYLPAQVNARSLFWMDRHGREASTGAPARSYLALRLAPDGTRVALDIRDQENDIWVWDLARRTMQKLTFGTPLDMFPIWTPDSRRIIFTSGRTDNDLYWQAADGSDAAERLTTARNIHTATSMVSDASQVLLTEAGEQGDDIMVLPLDGKGRIQPLVRTPFSERNAAISPDGRWVAYESDESGALQVFVRPFPDVNAGRWLLSPRGGAKPSWSRNGRELFYVDSEGALVSIPVETTPAFRAGDPVKLFDLRSAASLTNGRSYDVTPDGQRFIVIREPPPEATVSKMPQIVVVLNWLSEMQGKSKDP